MRKLLFFIFIFTISFQLYGQKLNHVLGEVIIEVEKDQSVDRLLGNIYNQNRNTIEIQKKKIMSTPMNLWVLKVNAAEVNELNFLDVVRSDKNVLLAQQNHLTSYRDTIPNDPEFINQWQYVNEGQSGGTEGADIDIELAWEISTGGITADGDTIVVCVIDDGVINDHEDWGDNLWVNNAEIPSDGIDNDGNGYIDDVRGWNAYNEDDNVYVGGGHGSPVAGIIGAQGNNGIGVAGVNWDVKVMVVRGGSPESTALASYAYPYTMRKLYNETNGEQGAFVVSTNASWGIDEGQPEDAPIWCDFYNILGEEGILNFGATANRNFNIDETGDLPTACDSDFMVAVTNMTHNDTKVNSAGYGLRTIDLGAFGADTHTISGTSYGGFGGTSGATPHVAGTAALMYSIDCPVFMALVKEDPSRAALVIKDYILNGTDPNANLLDITTSGGRLNVYNSMLKMQDYCGGCLEIGGVSVREITDVNATMTWASDDNNGSATIRYRLIDTEEWTVIEDIQSGYVFDDLDPCDAYEYQVRTACTDTTETAYSYTRMFETDGCCVLPDNIIAEINEENIVTATWDNVLAASSYIIEYKIDDATEWTVLDGEVNNSLELPVLEECSTVEIRLKTTCMTGAPESDYSEVILLSASCGACTQGYCEFGEKNTSDEWIGSIVIDDVLNYQGTQVDGGYTNNFNSFEFSLMTNLTYSISLTPDYSGTIYDETFLAIVDYNADGEFSEDEIIYSSEEVTNTTVSGEFTIPNEAILGITRMRVVMRYQDPATSCDTDGQFVFGDIVDFCVSIEEGPACPSDFTATIVDSTATSLSFMIPDDGRIEEYIIGYRKIGETEFLEVSNMTNEVVIDSLEECIEYEFYSSIICAGSRLENSDTNIAKTVCTTSVENTDLSSFSFFPNPTSGLLNVRFEEGIDHKVTLYNTSGVQIRSLHIGDNGASIDISDLQSGVYFISVKSDRGETIKKLIKI